MEKLNTDAEKLNVWVRTELNAPAQRAWFTDIGGDTGAGQLAAGGRVARNQVKALPARWRWKEYSAFLNASARSQATPTCRRSNSPTVRASC